MMSPSWAGAVIAAYLLGSIPTAYLVVRRLKRVDIRHVGSGNVGATNVTRAAGFTAGVLVFALDAAKGVAAVLAIARWWAPPSPAAPLACGLAAVIGHVYPVFLGFRGGKGVATTIGVLAGAMPHVAAVCLLVWMACFAVWRYVSLASLAAMAVLPAAQWAFGAPDAQRALGAALALLVIAKHRANIARLRQGTEPRWNRAK